MKNKVLVIMGPTAVGKTALGIQLAKKYNGEVINGDSLQVYRKLDIGTAKVTEEEMNGVPHHLIDIVDMTEPFTASDFKVAAEQVIEGIQKRNKLPILVGGSGLYIQGLLENMQFGNTGEDVAYRQQLEAELVATGSKELWEKLAAIDSKAAANIHPNNSRRVIRALEAIHVSGTKFSEQEVIRDEQKYDSLLIALDSDRTLLYDRINQRVDHMVEAGLIEEARMLYEEPKGLESQAIKGIGYKEWIPYFEGNQSREEVIEQIKQNSRRYAKRQLTWFRNRMKDVHWFDSKEIDYLANVEKVVDSFFEKDQTK
ncbi:tRNA (adenosine(37)-N6)-dimethylallyltransferase MiaA [Jeotgalibaca caeni]|uniref:tRNA (adenosine(37)-N6)-dimethylallyltransferase MiaA n=1 Tax=Jeotgalibaca caeni TaxID=3028623 RepID=UPI00237DD2F2|nr:tRNA (adenosine(37)-N6)-dimethylallyltransferase MiaA [Jeotgalibaca caeni]MDE1547852.1 tRNA (adenosine(37)-N6)-dimethylallyltransferase MiaA [Jeotgalibaca caeni]